ncbi:MAG TPA: cation:proton antiporter [Thermoanaerobacterium sp.]|nr:cation:proton antiporter [Thermoanaerobacterium sp.]
MTEDVIVNVGIAFVFITLANILSSRLKYSSIPFLILMGMLVGPHAPAVGNVSFYLVSPGESLEFLSRLGVLLMLFYLGLEFSAGKLVAAGRPILQSGIIYVGFNFIRGMLVGWFLFHRWPEAVIVGGITSVSSSAMVTKLLIDLKRTANPETELILGILVFEDVFIAVYLSILSALLITGDPRWPALLPAVLLIPGIILLVLIFGQRLARLMEPLFKFKTSECFTAAVFTLLLLVAVGVERINLAEAIGALLLGLVLAETTHNKRIIQMITPMRDLFAAMFFFSFGLEINYRLFPEVYSITLVIVVVTVTGNIIAGLLAAWLAGYKAKRAFNVAFTVMARGEFSVILASMAAASGTSGQLPSMAALYVLILAFVSPPLAKYSKNFYELYERIRGLIKTGRFWGKEKA